MDAVLAPAGQSNADAAKRSLPGLYGGEYAFG